MNKLWENIYNEANQKNLEQDTSNKSSLPYEDTPEAWFEKDNTGPESEDVVCGKFTWHREKSNRNINDTGDGKGFSFYLARYVFDDPYSFDIDIDNEPNYKNDTNDKTLGIVLENEIMVVITAKLDGDKIRIISAWQALPSSKYTAMYNRHKAKKQFLDDKFSKITENKKQKYLVIRKALGKSFQSNSYAKVINAMDLEQKSNENIPIYKGVPIYIQNFGDKDYCENIKNRIKLGLDYHNKGEDW